MARAFVHARSIDMRKHESILRRAGSDREWRASARVDTSSLVVVVDSSSKLAVGYFFFYEKSIAESELHPCESVEIIIGVEL